MKIDNVNILLLLVGIILILSGIFTADRMNWFLDVVWVIVGLPIVSVSRKYLKLTPLLYWLMAVHSLFLIGGGYYTYEQMPLGLWAQEVFGLARNHYDRIGHLLQGFVPALIWREVYIRWSPVPKGGWLFFIITCNCLAFGATFELIEWWAAVLSGRSGGEFLGHQGDNWDAQWDMLLCLIGALLALVTLSRLHDRQLTSLESK
ncbi:MAG: putative membrane protein [Pirellulaceae bacterium]|jgi:putative membrane protein